jgi:hypothetical protein
LKEVDVATVTGYTAERMKTIEDTTVVDGEIIGDNLHLLTRVGDHIDAGNVRGPKGDKGDKGDTGEVTQAELDALDSTVTALTTELRASNIPRFANVAARDTRFPTPAEGQMAYILDIKETHIYQAGAWRTPASSGNYLKGIPGATGNIGNTAWAQWTVAALGGLTLLAPCIVHLRCFMDVSLKTGGGYFTARILNYPGSSNAVFEQQQRAECGTSLTIQKGAGALGFGLEVAVFAAPGGWGATVNSTTWQIDVIGPHTFV